MRWQGWALIVLGVAGALACGYGIQVTREVKADIIEGTDTLAKEARDLLDAVDGRLKGLPARLNKLSESDRPKPVLDKLERVEGMLTATGESVDTVVKLLRAVSALKQGDDASVEERFPRLIALAATLTDLIARFRGQIDNAETWTLRFVALTKIVSGIRADVAETREQARELKNDALDTLDTLSLYTVLFLLWMGVGQVGLVVLGRQRSAQAGNEVGSA